MEYQRLLTSIERKSSDIENSIKNFDVRLPWDTILEKYTTLLAQSKSLEEEISINADTLRIVSVLPSNRASLDKDGDYLTSLLSVYRKYNKTPLNDSIIPEDIKGTIKTHNSICKRYEHEFQVGIKSISVPDRSVNNPGLVRNPFLEAILTGNGLRDVKTLKVEPGEKVDKMDEVEENKDEEDKKKKRKRVPSEIETLKVEEIRPVPQQYMQQMPPQVMPQQMQQIPFGYARPQMMQQQMMRGQYSTPYMMGVPQQYVQGYDPNQIHQPIPGQKPTKQVKK